MRLAATTLALSVLPLAACGQSEEDATTGTAVVESEAAPVGLDAPQASTQAAPSSSDTAPAETAPSEAAPARTRGEPPLAPDGSVDPEAVGEQYQDYVGQTN